MKRNHLIIGAVAIVLATVLVIRSLGQDEEPLSEEDRIRRVLDEVARLADERDARGLLEFIADDYEDSHGADKARVRQMLAGLFLRARRIGVHFRDVQVRLNGETEAEVQLRAILTRGKGALGEVIPTNATIYDFWIELEKPDGDWQVVSHRRRSVRGALF